MGDNLNQESREIAEFLSYYVEFREKVLRGEIPVCKELSDEMNRIDGLERLYNSLMNLGGNQSGGDSVGE